MPRVTAITATSVASGRGSWRYQSHLQRPADPRFALARHPVGQPVRTLHASLDHAFDHRRSGHQGVVRDHLWRRQFDAQSGNRPDDHDWRDLFAILHSRSQSVGRLFRHPYQGRDRDARRAGYRQPLLQRQCGDCAARSYAVAPTIGSPKSMRPSWSRRIQDAWSRFRGVLFVAAGKCVGIAARFVAFPRTGDLCAEPDHFRWHHEDRICR